MKIKKLLAGLTAILILAAAVSFGACNNGGNKKEDKVTVTFNLNYDGATGAPAAQTIDKGTVATKPANPSRSGYDFSGWYNEASCASEFFFTTTVEEDKTLYAGWLDNSATYVDVTFDYNYDGAPKASVQHVVSGEKAVKPADPVSDKGQFAGWTTAADGGVAYDFNTVLTANTTVYAQWSTTYVFEAEYTDLSAIKPCGWSGSPSDYLATIAYKDAQSNPELGASNDRFLSFLYREGTTVEFVIQSDRDISDATLSVRLSAEGGKGFPLMPSTYKIQLNDADIEYETIMFEDVPPLPGFLPFRDYTVKINASLKKGTNTIKLITANNMSLGGTTGATAPCIDCIKILTSAKLTWTPLTENIEGGLD